MRMKIANENSEKKRICEKKKAEFPPFIFYKRSWWVTCWLFETAKMIKKKQNLLHDFRFLTLIKNHDKWLVRRFNSSLSVELISKRAVQQYMLCCTIDRNEASIILIKKHDFYIHNSAFSFSCFQFVTTITSIMIVVRSKMNVNQLDISDVKIFMSYFILHRRRLRVHNTIDHKNCIFVKIWIVICVEKNAPRHIALMN